MTPLPSIRQRLSLALIGISMAWGLTVSVVVWFTVRHEVDALLDNTLQESAEILFGLLSFNAARLPLQGGGSLPAPPHDENLVWQVVDGTPPTVLLRSHHAPDQPLLARRTEGLASVGEHWRVFGIPFDTNGRMLYVAQRGHARDAARLEAATLTAGVALVIGLSGALWLRQRVRQELAPIHDMSQAVARFDPLHPDAPLAPPGRDELVPVHAAITGLGQRLAKRMANERAFSAHAAHALRTPLAGMVAQLAVAQRRAPPEVQPQLQRSREAADRLRRVVTALLTLFRTGAELQRQPVDLARLAAQLPFETLAIGVEGNPRLHADPDLLLAALMNLLDNALRHGATAVTLQARHGADGQHLHLRDNGAGLAEPQRQRLQAALDAQDHDSLPGLGLLLADLVARAHGGRLHLLPPENAPGCTLELSLGAGAEATVPPATKAT